MNFICLIKGHVYEQVQQGHNPRRDNQSPMCERCEELLAWNGFKWGLYNSIKGPYVPREENYLDVYDSSVERVELKANTIDYESYEDLMRFQWDCCD